MQGCRERGMQGWRYGGMEGWRDGVNEYEIISALQPGGLRILPSGGCGIEPTTEKSPPGTVVGGARAVWPRDMVPSPKG